MWTAHDDGNGNTYYVNGITGESAWEIPDEPAAATATRTGGELHIEQEDYDDDRRWRQVDERTDAYGTRWEGDPAVEQNNYSGADYSTNPFGATNHREYCGTTTAGATEGGGGGEGGGYDAYYGGGSVELTQGGTGDKDAGGWSQEWDEGSQGYYWYNAVTGESRW